MIFADKHYFKIVERELILFSKVCSNSKSLWIINWWP